MGGMNGMMGGFGLLWVIVWVAIIALIVWGVVQLAQGQQGGGQPEQRSDTAEETLRQRFARGEIDREEYERSLATLRGNPAPRQDPDGR